MNMMATEAFVNWCDSMMIAEEGLFKKKPLSVSKAVDVTTEDEMKQEMRGGEQIIHLTGPKAHQLVHIFKKMKAGGWSNSIASGVNSANGYGYTAYSQQRDVNNSGQGDAMSYKLKEYKGENYIFRGHCELTD
jgi:hypothetical protein